MRALAKGIATLTALPAHDPFGPVTALLRAHGLVTVGADVAEATVNAVLLERAARTTMSLDGAGTLAPMDDADIAALDERFERSRRQRVETVWDYLSRASR